MGDQVQQAYVIFYRMLSFATLKLEVPRIERFVLQQEGVD